MRGCGGWVWAQKKRGNVAFIDSISALFSKWGGILNTKTKNLGILYVILLDFLFAVFLFTGVKENLLVPTISFSDDNE